MAGKRPGDGTGIEWTHIPGHRGVTWNPTVGCTRVSDGCDHCYAFELHDRRYADNLKAANATVLQGSYRGSERIAEARRLGHSLPWPRQYDMPFSEVQVLDARIEEPLHWQAPRAVFVDSMSDLFHADVPDYVLDDIFAVMALTPQHVYMILTKRPERMRKYIATVGRRTRLASVLRAGFAHVGNRVIGGVAVAGAHAVAEGIEGGWRSLVFPNVWLGVSVEDQAAADSRIPLLLDTPAAVRFLSCEPLLGPLDLGERALGDGHFSRSENTERNGIGFIDWVIAGGESGSHYRAMNEDWARSLRDQCAATGTAFFYKQTSAPRPGRPGPPDLNHCKAFPL